MKIKYPFKLTKTQRKAKAKRDKLKRELNRLVKRLYGPPHKHWCPGCVICEVYWSLGQFITKLDERMPCKGHRIG